MGDTSMHKILQVLQILQIKRMSTSAKQFWVKEGCPLEFATRNNRDAKGTSAPATGW